MTHMRRARTLSIALFLLASACTSESSKPVTTPPSPPATTTSVGPSTPSSTTSLPLAQEAPVAAYFIGNSLTWDTLGAQPRNFVSLNALALQADQLFKPIGYHILCGSSLVNIAENPDQTCVDPAEDIGPLAQAFPSNTWEVVSVQPYPGDGSTLLSDETMIRDIMASANPAAEFYILTGWPGISEFQGFWTSDVSDTDETPTVLARQYFELLGARLSDVGPVTIVPVGDVLFELGKRIDAGDIPGLTDLSQLYRDDIHLTDRGRWAAGVTAASVILDADPYEFGKPRAPWYGNSTGFSKEYIAAVREVVEMVLTGR